MMTVTVHSGPERRRRWTSAEKLVIVEESFAEGARVVDVARQHDIHPNLLHLWRRQARTGAISAAGAGARFVPVRIAVPEGARPAGVRCAEATPWVEIVLRNGRLLRLPEGVAPARAAALADALEGR